MAPDKSQPKNTSPKNTIIDAKEALFDKIFNENQELREQNRELNRILESFEGMAGEREEQYKRFAELEENILKTENLNDLTTIVRSGLAADFNIPTANIVLIENISSELTNIPDSVATEPDAGHLSTITTIAKDDYNRLFPENSPLITRDPNPALIALLPDPATETTEIGSAAYIPLLSRSRSVGILVLASPDTKKFIPGTATNAVETLGRKLAIVIENSLLREQLLKLAPQKPAEDN